MKKITIFAAIIALLAIGFVSYKYFNDKQGEINPSDFSLSDIKNKGKLIVGIDIPYGVMEFSDASGTLVGIDIDIAKEITSVLGVQPEFKLVAWDLLIPAAVQKGEVDLVISSMTITEERKKEMLISAPYFNAGQVIVIKSKNKDINSIDDISGKKIGVQLNTTGSKFIMEKYSQEESITVYETNLKNFDALKNGEVDLILTDYINAIDMIKKDPSLKIAGNPITQEFYGMATKLGNNTLMDKINNILREMKRNGQLKQIEDKWLK